MSFEEIDVDQLEAHMASGARVVDVRELWEYEQARIPGSVLVPLATVPQHVGEFLGSDPTYVVCRSGGRSVQACRFLAAEGADVVNVAGGVMAWIQSGRAVETGPA